VADLNNQIRGRLLKQSNANRRAHCAAAHNAHRRAKRMAPPGRAGAPETVSLQCAKFAAERAMTRGKRRFVIGPKLETRHP
jgi:hypothetical protein